MRCLSPVIINLKLTRLKKDFTPISDDLSDYYNNPYEIVSTPSFVPCGKCFSCRQSRVRFWTVRAIHEYQSNYIGKGRLFVTLTYSPEYLGNNNLDYSQVQKYIKLVRKHIPKTYPIKYIAVGEYGFQSGRMHWHILFYGFDYSDRFLLKKYWKYGFAQVKRADDNATYYLLKYSFKQFFQTRDEYIEKGITPPVFHCSQGFGKSFISDFDNFSAYIEKGYFTDGIRKYGFPRYYREQVIKSGFVSDDYFVRLNDFLFPSIIEDYVADLEKCNAPPDFIEEIRNTSLTYFTFTQLNLIKSYTYSYYNDINNKKYEKFKKAFKEAI